MNKAEMTLQKINTTTCSLDKTSFPSQLQGKPAEHRLTGEEMRVWTQDVAMQIKGGSHEGRGAIRCLDNLFVHLFCIS